MKKYWMIHRENGGSPQKKHESGDDAMGEVDRLAQENPGVKFAILEATMYGEYKPLPSATAFHNLKDENVSDIRGGDFHQPEIFMVHHIENPNAMETYITVKPSIPAGMGSSGSGNWTSMKRGDCLVSYTEKSIIRYWVLETPTCARIKVTCGGEIKKGDRLTLVMNTADREENNAG